MLTSYLARACAALQRTGDLLRSLKLEGQTAGTWIGSQFKADADRLAHERLAGALSAIEPGIPVVSEEDESSLLTRAATYWLIDPIDGTASFAHGFSGYVCQAALLQNEIPVIGAVFAPELNLLFAAQRGAGASCNAAPLAPPPRTSLTLIDNYPEPRGLAAEAWKGLGCAHYVESGSIGLKLCRVADGTADVFVKDMRARDWDLAAPHVILTEAGGALTDLAGNPVRYGTANRGHDGIIATTSDTLQARVVAWAGSRARAAGNRGTPIDRGHD